MFNPSPGVAVLLLHGVSRRMQTFAPLLPHLACHGTVMSMNFRGHGDSPRMPGRYRVIDYVDDAFALLEMARGPVIIYGHSLGALVAGAVASARPDSVRAIILEDPPGALFLDRLHETPYHALFTVMQRLAGSSRSVPTIARELAEVRLPTADGRGEVRLADVRDAVSLRFTARCLVDLDPDVFAPILARRWLVGYDWETIWRGVRCPALLLRADPSCGGMLPAPEAETITNLMTDCTVVHLPGVNHLIHSSVPEKAARLVHDFLGSL